MAEREERFIIVVFNERDGEWEAVPDAPDNPRVTPFKVLANARYRLETLQDRYPERTYRGATLIIEEGWAP